jgi:1-acyl-sn-glycerol-3-phosphate acyltransferase
MLLARVIVALVGRLRVSGDVPDSLRRGPLILAANHLSPFDPIALAAACHARRLAPRYLATGGLFRAPVVGAVMRHWGHIPVHRGTTEVARAIPDTAAALAAGAVVLVYPEGRITLDPELWPERGKTGVARLALTTGVTVVPVSQWGTHEVVPYRAPRGLLRALPGTVRRRPVIRVHFGAPVELGGLVSGSAGHAQRGTDRILDAITTGLMPLRADEPGTPRHVDLSRPRDPRRSRRQAGPRSRT